MCKGLRPLVELKKQIEQRKFINESQLPAEENLKSVKLHSTLGSPRPSTYRQTTETEILMGNFKTLD